MAKYEAVELAAIRGLARSGDAKRIRERAGLARADLALELGVSTSTVARWEDGTRSPRRAIAIRYARLLDALKAAS